MKIYRQLLKTPLTTQSFRAGLAWLIFTASAVGGYGQTTNYVGVFTNSATVALWSHAEGDANTETYLATDAPTNGPSTGCMVYTATYGPSEGFSAIGKNVSGLNVSNYAALEMDVKVDPGQAEYDTYGNSCNSFEVGVNYGPSQNQSLYTVPPIAPTAAYNGWQHLIIPVANIDGGNVTNWGDIDELIILPDDNYFPTNGNMILRMANIMFTSPAPVPAVPTISINAGGAIRTADTRWFGINSGVYDADFNLQDTPPEMSKAGYQSLRFPGGSMADYYNWASNYTGSQTYYMNNDFTNFARVATNIGAAPYSFITVNYGTGTPAEAAAWVAFSNVTNHYGFKYWEIGNECYADPGETDSNTPPWDPYEYATRAATYITEMKAADPTIKCGVVVAPVGNEVGYSNDYTNNPATNLVTGQVLHGWTPVVLGTLYQLGVMPDFVIYHWYPENNAVSPDNDASLLAWQSNDGDMPAVGAAAELRAEITDFLGPGGTNVEMCITEHNSEEGTPGMQSVSLVNGLYYADSLGQLMQTEFNGSTWWQLHDGGPPAAGGTMTGVYGWRQYGALGVMWPLSSGFPLTNRFPQYFAAEMISRFIRAGDTVVSASCNNPLVSAYSALRTNGDLTLMAINKSSVSNYTVNIVITNFVPVSTATNYSYGMPNDNAAEAANDNCDITTNVISGVSTNFNYTLAPYSINVFSFVPAPTPVFYGLGDYTIPYGTAGVPLSGTVSTNGTYPPSGTAVTVTINGNAQGTTISDSTGDFSFNYNGTGLPAGATPYVVTYSSAAGGGFNSAISTNSTLTVNQLPVVLTGSEGYNGTTTVSASILSVSNLVGGDNVTLSGSVGLASGNVGAESITSFSGLTLGGTAGPDYTLAGASGTVTITGSGVILGGVSVSPDGTQFMFSYPTVLGQSYQLEYSTNLSSGVWLPMGGPVTGTGAPVSVTNSISSSMQMFFILSITP
jgi:alpha-L-arabinofuranosidase